MRVFLPFPQKNNKKQEPRFKTGLLNFRLSLEIRELKLLALYRLARGCRCDLRRRTFLEQELGKVH